MVRVPEDRAVRIGVGDLVGLDPRDIGDHETFPNQLYIHPDECIDCGACEPECPWQAIFEEAAVPDPFKDDTPLNYLMMEHKDDFIVSPTEKKPQPSATEIEENKRKWGFTA